jgi:site-specific DNA-methyltransferase (adenine-specific)
MSNNTAVSKAKGISPYFSKDGIVLYHANYEEVFPLIKSESVDTIITDPPYATTQLEWDKAIDWNFFWSGAARVCKLKSPMVFFASGKFTNQLAFSNWKNYRYDLIWEKNIAVGFLDAKRRPLRSHESILVFTGVKFRGTTYNPQMTEGKLHKRGKKKIKCSHYGGQKGGVPEIETNLYYPKSVLRFPRPIKSLHPTQKPLELLEYLVKTYSNHSELILEPFAGSGTTMVAAYRNNRKCIGIEQNEAYCEIIAKRIERGE